MLKMSINQDAIEHPILCKDCDDHAAVLFFENLVPQATGVVMHLRKKYAKCYGHLTMDEAALPSVS